MNPRSAILEMILLQDLIESATGSQECSGVSAAVYNILRDYIDSEPSCIAAHEAATSLYDTSAHSSAENNSFLGYGSLVLAVQVLHALDVTDQAGILSSAGIPEGHGGVLQLSISVGLGSDAAQTGMSVFVQYGKHGCVT